MITEKLISDVLSFIESKVSTAEIVIDGNVKTIQIMQTKIEGNILKIFTNLSDGKGSITDIRIKDSEGNVILTKPQGIIKNYAYGIVSSFYIQLEEKEITDPIDIFEVSKGVDNGSI